LGKFTEGIGHETGPDSVAGIKEGRDQDKECASMIHISPEILACSLACSTPGSWLSLDTVSLRALALQASYFIKYKLFSAILQLMSERTDKVISLLEPFGISVDEARVYLELLEKGTATALQVSRNIGIGRTKVYRILDKLIEFQLVTQKYQESGFAFVANDPAQFKMLLSKREGEVVALKYMLPDLVASLNAHSGRGKPGSEVLYYKGKRGLTQVNFNLLKAKGEFLSYEVGTADVYMDHHEAEELRRELVQKRILVRTLTNVSHIEPFTEVSELVKQWWEIKYIDPKILTIKTDVFIYNHVYAMCHYLDKKDVFCLEMHNAYMAQMQREMFEVMWEVGEEMEIVSDKGEARVLQKQCFPE
jgi:predicted transcriptional regulator